MAILWSGRYKEDRTRKYSNGALHVADGQVTRKSRSGMHFSESAAGEMKRAKNSASRRRKRVSAIARTSKHGWTCMTRRKEERQLSPEGRDASSPELLESAVLVSPCASTHESAVNLLAEYPAIHVDLCS